MLATSATLALFGFFCGIGLYGIALLRQAGASRWLGGVLLVQALLGSAAQIALCTIPFGIGEPLIRVDLGASLLTTLLTVLTLGGSGALVYWLTRRSVAIGRTGIRRAVITGILLAVPIIGSAALWGLSRATLPARELERDPARREITLSPGFSWNIYASGTIDNPTAIVFGPDGELYIGDIGGTLWLARDTDSDYRVDTIMPWASGFKLLVGLAWYDGELYVASSGKIEALADQDGDGQADQRRTLVEGLPSMVLTPHSNNAIVFGPDNRLYFGVGSTVSGEIEPNELAAAVLSVKPDGSDLRVFARGFGNTFGIAFNSTGDLFGGDNSPGADSSYPDEFNHIVEGEHYGYPYVYGNSENDRGTTLPLALFPPHASPTGMSFYTGNSFPAEFNDSAFVTLWSRGEIARIELAKTAGGSYLSRTSIFGSGFLSPITAITGPDGNLYVADFGTSVVYRISYEGV